MAKQLLTHTYTLTSPEHAAPILTTIGYRFARLTDHMLGAGIIAGWNTDKNTAHKTILDIP